MTDIRPLEIPCEEVWKELSNYIDGEVDEVLRARMKAHFAECAHCTAILDGTNNVVQLVGDARAFPVPAGFADRLRARLQRREP